MRIRATLSLGVGPLVMIRRQASLKASVRDTRARGQVAGVALLTIQALAPGLLRALTTFMPERMVTSTATTRRLEIGLRTRVADGREAPIRRSISSNSSMHEPLVSNARKTSAARWAEECGWAAAEDM